MAVVALVISVGALSFSALVAFAARRQTELARHANALPVLIELFREHRSGRLAQAREFVVNRLGNADSSKGLEGVPEEDRVLVQELAWFYDNVGALVTYDVIDIEPVSGYFGGAVLNCWRVLEPFIEAERERRTDAPDPASYQQHFENLAALIERTPPRSARTSQRNWLIG
jgi:hypothetical protein